MRLYEDGDPCNAVLDYEVTETNGDKLECGHQRPADSSGGGASETRFASRERLFAPHRDKTFPTSSSTRLRSAPKGALPGDEMPPRPDGRLPRRGTRRKHWLQHCLLLVRGIFLTPAP